MDVNRDGRRNRPQRGDSAGVVRRGGPRKKRLRGVSWRPSLTDLAAVPNLVLALGTDSRVVYLARCEHSRVRFGHERTAVLTFRHFSSSTTEILHYISIDTGRNVSLLRLAIPYRRIAIRCGRERNLVVLSFRPVAANVRLLATLIAALRWSPRSARRRILPVVTLRSSPRSVGRRAALAE